MECLLETVGDVDGPFPFLWDSSLAGTLGDAGKALLAEPGVTGDTLPASLAPISKLKPELEDSRRLSMLLAFRKETLK